MMSLVVAGAILLVLALIISGKLRVLVKGLIGVFVEDAAKTPEGARAVFNQKIEEMQENYNKANNVLQRVTGQLDTAKLELEKFKKLLVECETKCERFASLSQFDKVQLFAQERESLREEITSREELIGKLTPMYNDAKEINQRTQEALIKLKKEQKKTVNDLQINKQMKETYDAMDELKNTTHLDKLLDAVKDGVKESRESAVGARIVHENKVSTKLERANAEDRANQSSEYVESLKKKYQK